MTRHFTLEYWKDEDWYVGRLKEIPGVFSQGESLEELERNIQEAYELMLEESDDIVLPTKPKHKEIEVRV